MYIEIHKSYIHICVHTHNKILPISDIIHVEALGELNENERYLYYFMCLYITLKSFFIQITTNQIT